ncbi:hypothetical protein ACFLYD_01770 [Chloroflexota bacterium]
MSHPFEVGKTYRNRLGEYVVQDIDGEQMTIRYVGGGLLATSVDIQARIWENIQFEEQMQREDERLRLAREARLASRKRSLRAKAEKAKPVFGGFQESDFQPKKRGIAWSSREELGKALAYELGQRTEGSFSQWIVPRQSKVHVARKDHYDRDARDEAAAFFVAVSEQGVTYGFRVGKPDGEVQDESPWSAFAAALGEDPAFRRMLRAAMKKYELSLDVYAMEMSYGQVGQISVQPRGFLWQHETADQEMTQRMSWQDLVAYLHSDAFGKRSELYLRHYLPGDAALEAGPAVAGLIATVFESLVLVYDASVGA